MKKKENGLDDYGVIELEVEAKSADSAVAESPELELGKQIFCGSWPAVLIYLQNLKNKIKNPILRFLCGAGLGIIDNLHDATCKAA
ncbi:MAG: hypothetical protein ACOYM0_01375 [Bacteroidales bacterium]